MSTRRPSTATGRKAAPAAKRPRPPSRQAAALPQAPSFAQEICHRISAASKANPVGVHTPFDFLDLGLPHSVGMALTRRVRSGALRRLARGLYDAPRPHPLLGELQPSTDEFDLAVWPRVLGFETAELDEAPSASRRRKRVQALQAECERCVSERFRPALEAAIAATLGDRIARHFADFESLWRHPSRADALARLDLLEDVVRHKRRFFASAWTDYEIARPGMFRLVPPPSRHANLARDYATMAPMFIGSPIEFNPTLQCLHGRRREAQRREPAASPVITFPNVVQLG